MNFESPSDWSLSVGFKQKGGIGESELLAILCAMFSLAGIEALVIDGDVGHRTFRHRYGKNAAISIPDHKEIEPAALLEKLRLNHRHIILDLPGSFPSRKDEAAGWVWSLIELAITQGAKVTAFFVAGSNSEGSTKSAIKLLDHYQLNAENIIVLNDHSGSNKFDEFAELDGKKVLKVPYVHPGIHAALRKSARPLAETILYPDPKFYNAAQIYLRHIFYVCSQDALSHIAPDAALKKLKQMMTSEPLDLLHPIMTEAHATNSAILANRDFTYEFRGIMEESLLLAFWHLVRTRRAYEHYHRTVRSGRV